MKTSLWTSVDQTQNQCTSKSQQYALFIFSWCEIILSIEASMHTTVHVVNIELVMGQTSANLCEPLCIHSHVSHSGFLRISFQVGLFTIVSFYGADTGMKVLNLHCEDDKTVEFNVVQARVTIVDTTESGVVQFSRTHITVQCTKEEVQVPVIRKGGCNGSITLTYATQTDTVASGVLRRKCMSKQGSFTRMHADSVLLPGIDFEHTSGRLSFESGESKKMIAIPLKGNPQTGTFTLSLKALNDHSGIQVSFGVECYHVQFMLDYDTNCREMKKRLLCAALASQSHLQH